MRPRTIAVVIMCVALAGAACGADGVARSPASAPATSTSSTSTSGKASSAPSPEGLVELPLDAYELSDDANATVVAAQEHLIARCMKAQGFEYEPAEDSEAPPKQVGVTDEAYGLSEFADAARFGYAGEDINERIRALREGEGIRAEVSPAYLEALTGNADPAASGGQPKGCMGEAAATLNGEGAPSLAVLNVIGQIAVDAAARTRSDPAVLDGFAAWSDCMAEAGYEFASPSEPSQTVPQVIIDINDLQSVPAPSETEVAMALADQDCKRQVGLFDIWVEAEERYQREGIAQHESVLSEYESAVYARVATARRVLEQR